jgi:ferritin-like metal-binding protein YciE
MLLDRFDTARELFVHKLGTALKMEKVVLEMLGRLEKKAQSEELKEHFRHHAEETRGQIANLGVAFGAIEEEPDEKAAPVIQAIDVESRANIKRTDERLVDAVILAGAAETEHHEIGVYEWLIAHAEAMGLPQAAEPLRQNLEQEKHTLEEVRRATETIAGGLAQRAA